METTLLKEALVSFIENMAVGDYCYVGESIITRTTDGFDVEDNGEGVTVETAFRALVLALENEWVVEEDEDE